MLWISLIYTALNVISFVNCRPDQNTIKDRNIQKYENTNCGLGFFLCDSSNCISEQLLCNGEIDCLDESDEDVAFCVQAEMRDQNRSKRSLLDSLLHFFVKPSICIVTNIEHGSFKLLGSSSTFIVDNTQTTVSQGTLLSVICNPGYEPDGVTTFTCSLKKMFLNTACKKACPALRVSTLEINCKRRNRIVPCDEFVLPGTIATFKCKYSHVVQPFQNNSFPTYDQAYCSVSGQWDVPLYSCVPDGCILPLQPENGQYLIKEGQLTMGETRVLAGTSLKVTCDPGYKLVAERPYYCRSQQWHNAPRCVKTCDPLISPSLIIKCFYEKKTVSCDEAMLPHTEALINCKHSFIIQTPPDYNSTTCLENGSWSHPLYNCMPEGCTAPKIVTNGRFHISGDKPSFTVLDGKTIVPEGSFLDIKCNLGHKLDGPNGLPCRKRSWGPISTCLKTCPPLQRPSLKIMCTRNGLLVACDQEMLPGTRAKLACKFSYSRENIEYDTVTCLGDGEWSQPLYSCKADCGQEGPPVTPVVVGGGETEFGLYPWNVALYRYYGTNFYANLCGGSLITAKIVLTAAYCFKNVYNVNLYRVAAGTLYREWQNVNDTEAQTREIDSIITGPGYAAEQNYFFDDIALIIVKDLFTLTSVVLPVCVNWTIVAEEKLESNGTMAQVSGWGIVAARTPTKKLKTLSMPIVDYDICKNETADSVKYLLNKICAGRSDGQNVCNGDSGGGLTVKWNELHYLVGLVSVINGKDNYCDVHKYAIFTQVSRYKDWIQHYIDTYRVL